MSSRSVSMYNEREIKCWETIWTKVVKGDGPEGR